MICWEVKKCDEILNKSSNACSNDSQNSWLPIKHEKNYWSYIERACETFHASVIIPGNILTGNRRYWHVSENVALLIFQTNIYQTKILTSLDNFSHLKGEPLSLWA